MVENIEADQSYFLAEVNYVTRNTFDKNLANIAPFYVVESGFVDLKNVCLVRLHPTHGFLWKIDVPNTNSLEEGVIPPTRWNMDEITISKQDA